MYRLNDAKRHEKYVRSNLYVRCLLYQLNDAKCHFDDVVSSEVHLVQKQLTQSENDNAALRTDKGKLETKAGQLVRHT